MTGIAVIIPTVGRESVWACAESVASQLTKDDWLHIAYDGGMTYADYMVYEGRFGRIAMDSPGHASWSYVPDGPLGSFGHPARNYALDILLNDMTHVWSIDDDDQALPGALDAIHALVDLYEPTAPERWFAFQMLFGPNSHAAGHTVWREKKVELGNIGTPCIVMPTSAKSRWGALGVDPRTGWYGGEGYFGDYQIARDLEAELGPPVWVPTVVAEIRP